MGAVIPSRSVAITTHPPPLTIFILFVVFLFFMCKFYVIYVNFYVVKFIFIWSFFSLWVLDFELGMVSQFQVIK